MMAIKQGIAIRIIGCLIVLLAAFILFEAIKLFAIPSVIRDVAIDLPIGFVMVSLMLIAGLGLVLLRIWGVYIFFISTVINWAVILSSLQWNDLLNKWHGGDISGYALALFLVAPFMAGVIIYNSRQSLK